MSLTEEQKERIRKNRERALEIRRKKLEERSGVKNRVGADPSVIGFERTTDKKNSSSDIALREDGNVAAGEKVQLEEFEMGASPYVTKKEAMKMYCLPEGTLAVCAYIEKDNPRQSKWSKMKLYHRNEIRRRARSRFGGLEGLINERKTRERKRFERDFEKEDIFSTKRQKKL